MNSEFWDLKDNEKHSSVLLYLKKWEGGIYHKHDHTIFCFKVFVKLVRFIINTFGTMI